MGDNSELKEDCDKVLGLPWNYKSDKFVLQFRKLIELSKNLSPTKRNLLKMTATLFDPLGLISPAIVQMKMVLQDACLLKLDWDSKLPNELIETLRRCLNEFEKVEHLRIERCYLSRIEEEINSYSLHGFCDASKKAYCAVIYLVITTESEGLFGKLIASRSRVTPIKKLTTPRLELMAAVILARLITTIKNSLINCIDIDSVNCWGDSNIVLASLKNDQNYKQFVSNRTAEILKLTKPKDWRYCPTDCNPPDIGTRGQIISKLRNNSFWFNGPDWLTKSQEFWPKQSDFKGLQKSEENEEFF